MQQKPHERFEARNVHMTHNQSMETMAEQLSKDSQGFEVSGSKPKTFATFCGFFQRDWVKIKAGRKGFG